MEHIYIYRYVKFFISMFYEHLPFFTQTHTHTHTHSLLSYGCIKKLPNLVCDYYSTYLCYIVVLLYSSHRSYIYIYDYLSHTSYMYIYIRGNVSCALGFSKECTSLTQTFLWIATIAGSPGLPDSRFVIIP